MKELYEVTPTHRIIPYANKIVNAKAYEFEQDFRALKAELADEYISMPTGFVRRPRLGESLQPPNF